MTDQSPIPSDAVVPLDIVWGAPAIAALINRGVRETYHLLESDQNPLGAKKIGGRWCVSRRKLAGVFDA